METGFAVTAFLALILNLILPEEIEDEGIEITADKVGEDNDEREWERIRRPSQMRAIRKSEEARRASQNSMDVEHGPDGLHAIHDVEKMPPVKED